MPYAVPALTSTLDCADSGLVTRLHDKPGHRLQLLSTPESSHIIGRRTITHEPSDSMKRWLFLALFRFQGADHNPEHALVAKFEILDDCIDDEGESARPAKLWLHFIR